MHHIIQILAVSSIAVDCHGIGELCICRSLLTDDYLCDIQVAPTDVDCLKSNIRITGSLIYFSAECVVFYIADFPVVVIFQISRSTAVFHKNEHRKDVVYVHRMVCFRGELPVIGKCARLIKLEVVAVSPDCNCACELIYRQQTCRDEMCSFVD